jgi:hypothetical protein
MIIGKSHESVLMHLHASIPSSSAVFPAGHRLQSDTSTDPVTPAYFPSGHFEQSSGFLPFIVGLYLPGGHSLQMVAKFNSTMLKLGMGSRYLPGGQGIIWPPMQ